MNFKNFIYFLFTIAFIYPTQIFPLPRFSLKENMRCSSCHTNPTGGQMRNEYGTTYSLDKLSLESTFEEDFSFDPKLSDNITIGADVRTQFLSEEFSHLNTFQLMTASLYASARLSKKITLYLKQDIVNGTYGNYYGGTEVFGMLKLFPKFYIKGGSFLPDFGWKQDDHTIFTRAKLFFPPNYKDIGIEFGSSLDNIFVTAGIFNGTGNYSTLDYSRHKAFVVKAEIAQSVSRVHYVVGFSGYQYQNYKMGGIHLSANVDDVIFLGEIDWTNGALDIFSSPPAFDNTSKSMAMFAEIDYRFIQGLWLTGRYEQFDTYRSVRGDEKHRIVIGAEFFPYSFVEIRPQYRFNVETPTVSNNQFLIQSHLWF